MRIGQINEYPVGSLAYLDAFTAGLVPCKVLEITSPQHVKVLITADRPGFKRGTVEEWRTNRVVPRPQVYSRDRQYRIRQNYRWV